MEAYAQGSSSDRFRTGGTPGVSVTVNSAAAQPAPPPPALAPGWPATYKSAAELAAVLQKATANPAGMLSSPVTSNEQYRVSVINRAKPASIDNGVSQRLTKGDVIIVPVGSPHWFSVIDAPVTYLEVRWVSPGLR